MFDDGPSRTVSALDDANAAMARAQRAFLELVHGASALGVWRDDGARDFAYWLSIRYGISGWKARRWIAAASALEGLPGVDSAFTDGRLSLDKTVELTRFARPGDEGPLVRWASDVSVATVRRRGDRTLSLSAEETASDERARRLEWWWFEDRRRLGISGELPAAQGAVVVNALQRAGERVAEMPGEDEPWSADARRADALVALCSAAIASDPDPDRATVVLHARVDETGLLTEAEIEGATAVPRSVAERLLCDARVHVVVEDDAGDVVRTSATRREPRRGWCASSGIGIADAGSGLRDERVHPGPPRPLVVARWADRSRQPRARVLVPPPTGARARLGDPLSRHRGDLDHAGRGAVPLGTASPDQRVR